MSAPEIVPETRVAELLSAYPELEEELIRIAPRFAALRNPVLRRTVARVATLTQAASVGGVSARELVDALRAAVGQPPLQAAVGSTELQPPSDDLADADPFEPIDADTLLSNGETPLTVVTWAVDRCPAGSHVRLTASFLPAPLVDAVRRRGATVEGREDEGTWTLWIRPFQSGDPS